MRRILVYEHLTATADTASPLYAEGKAMLDAVVEDLRALPEVEVTVWPPQRPESELGVAASSVDGVLIVAPETGGTLERLCRMVEGAGGKLLGSPSAAVRLTGDKVALCKHLQEADVQTPPCRAAGSNDWPYPQVCKPRDGAGSQATFLVQTAEDWPRCIEQARREGFHGDLIAQRFVPGIAASVSILLGVGVMTTLAPMRQLLSEDGRFKYLRSRMVVSKPLSDRATRLAICAVTSMHDLHGYVGVDLVLGPARDGSDDYVIEINPRMTSSYLNLRRIMRDNLMDLMLMVIGLHGE